MRKSTCLLPKLIFTLAFGLALSVSQQEIAFAQGDVIPATSQSGGFFNRQLGTALRFNYHTQGYGTQDDVFSLGGMKVFNMDGATAFLDGQGTLSDDFGGGFNLGAGYRQLATLGTSFDPQRIMGASFWTDGQSSANDNFFTQLGFSLESLGDAYDVRFSGYFPLSRTKNGDAELTGTGDPFFSGNNIFGATQSIGVDTALDVLDGELAFRIQDLEAWAFAGAYYVGGGADDTAGYRAGARGYALPDLAVSLSVTDDDIYDTNVMFGITWFIGRTHKGNAPCGTLLDRFREPVIRNDFIAMETSRVSQQSGDALTSPTDNEAIRIVHVDSNDGTSVAGGGDGTFENPFADISDIDAIANPGSSMDGDIILVHGGSTVTGTATLQANQSVLGEGVDQDMNQIPHIVATNELGNINLPETATGSLDLARPITTSAGTPFTLADNNTINNFTINNAATAVLADTVTTPTLQNLQINDATTGLTLRDITGTTVVENTVQINRATTRAIDVDQGADGMSIAAAINDSSGQSLVVQNRLGGTIDFTGTISDQADIDGDMVVTESQGVLIQNNTDTTVNFTNTNDIHVAGTDTGIQIINNATTTVNASGLMDITASGDADGLVVANTDTGSAVTFADLNATAVDGNTVDVQNAGAVTISSPSSTVADPRGIANTGTGNALFNEGNLADADRNATLIVNSNITNAGGGQAVNIINRSANDVTINGTVDVDDMMSGGVFAQGNVDGNIIFTNTLTLDTGTSNAVLLQNNADLGMGTTATISFTDLNIDTTTGDGFTATGGGNLIVTSTNGTNTIDVVGAGTALNLDGMTIDPANVAFDVVNADGSATGIILRDLDGTGQVQIGGGTNGGDGGTLATTGTAIEINDVSSAVLTNMIVGNDTAPNEGPGVVVTNQDAGSTATFNTLTVRGTTNTGINVNNNQDGAIIFTDLESTTTSGTAISVVNNNSATTSFNNMNVTTTTGLAFNAAGDGALIATRTAPTTNSITTTGGQAISMLNTEIGIAGFTVDTVNVTGGAGAGVGLTNVSGGAVTLGSGTNAGDGGTIATNAAVDAMSVDNVENLTVNNISLDNAGVGGGLTVISQEAGSSATFNNLTSSAGDGNAVSVGDGNAANSNEGGAISFNTLAATADGNGDGISINNENTSVANIDIDDVTVDTASGSGRGFAATGGGTITMAGTNAIDSAGDTAFEANNVRTLTASNVTIANTTAQGVVVTGQSQAGDSVTLNNFDVTTTTADSVTVSGNTDGTVTLSGLTAEATTGDAVFVNNNTGSTVSINGMTATTTDGDAFTATNGGTLAVTGTNSVTSGLGQAVIIDSMTIGNTGATFASVDVTGGTGVSAGIELTNLTGGQVAVNGGNIANAASTIAVTNVESASFNNMTLNSGSADAVTVSHTSANASAIDLNSVTITNGIQGIDIVANGTGELDVTMDDVTISGVSAEGVAFDEGANTDRVDLTLINSDITAGDASAFAATLDDSNTADIRFVIDDNIISNNSGTADSDSAALSINLSSGLLLSARVGNLIANEADPSAPLGDSNRFTNSSADGDPLRVVVTGGILNLDLRDNTALGGTIQYSLTNNGGTFNLVDSADTVADSNNIGDVIDNGPDPLNQIAPPILAPTP